MQKDYSKKILILGVTSSGKSRLAFELAQQSDAEIISIDSMKVYKRMDIGTAKPSVRIREKIKYHLIDVAEPSEPFNVGTFLDLVQKAVEQIKARNKQIIAVGGTAMYIKALLYGLFEGPGTDDEIRQKLKQREKQQGKEKLYQQLQTVDPDAAERIHPNDSKRIIRALEVYEMTGKPISTFQQQWNCANTKSEWTVIGLRREKQQESGRINARVKKMIELGLIDEVKALLAEDKPLSKQARCAIGYAEIIEHLNGNIELEEAMELIKKNTRHLAKHQRTWFKTFSEVNWLDIEAEESSNQILSRAEKLLTEIEQRPSNHL